VRKRELVLHSPGFLSAIHIPIASDPELLCSEVEKFSSEVFPEADPNNTNPGRLLVLDRSAQILPASLGKAGMERAPLLAYLPANFVGTENVSTYK
jgi:hypothetical protein